jgi:hypothetical protein
MVLDVQRETAYKVMSAYKNHGKTTSAKRKSGRKPTLIGSYGAFLEKITELLQQKWCRWQQNWAYIYLAGCDSTKTVHVIFSNAAATVRLQLLYFCWLLSILFTFVNDGVTATKTCTSDNLKHVMWSDENSSTLFPTLERAYVWKTSKKAYDPECLVPTEVLWLFGLQYLDILLVT